MQTKKTNFIIKNELALYDKYLTGDMWGFTIKEVQSCDLGHEHEKVISSCFGFFDKEEAEEAGQEEIKAYK